MNAPRMTIPTRMVLEALLAVEESFGAEIGRRSGLPSGTVHPILARLEGLGWVRSRWEVVDTSDAGRPARRFYSLTADGRRAAEAALARAASRAPRAVARLREA